MWKQRTAAQREWDAIQLTFETILQRGPLLEAGNTIRLLEKMVTRNDSTSEETSQRYEDNSDDDSIER